eukprot:333830-Amphidinium_carterae.1
MADDLFRATKSITRAAHLLSLSHNTACQSRIYLTCKCQAVLVANVTGACIFCKAAFLSLSVCSLVVVVQHFRQQLTAGMTSFDWN